MDEFFIALEELGVKPGIFNQKVAWKAEDIVKALGYEDIIGTIKHCIGQEQFQEGLEYEIIKYKNKVENVIEFKPMEYIFYEQGLYGIILYTRTPIGKELRRKMIKGTGHTMGELFEMFLERNNY